MFSDQITLPSESLIAGTTRNFIFYLYTKGSNRQIDANGMVARFSITDFVNQSDIPFLTKDCSVVIPDGEQLAIFAVTLNRNDTLGLRGKYIYQVTVNDRGIVFALKGIMDIANNFDKLSI